MGIFSKRRSRNSRSNSGSLLRWFGPGATSAGMLYAVYMLVSGGWSFSALDGLLGTNQATEFRGEPVTLANGAERPIDRIRVATFNIKQFGITKSSARENDFGVDVLGTIAHIVSTFDIVAIQEIQSADQVAVKALVDLIRQSGGNYAATTSDLIGDVNRREAYAFVWDESRVQFIPGSSYVVRDDGERMYREPMVATFQARLPPPGSQTASGSQTAPGSQAASATTARPFRFTLINVHTDPDEVDPNVPDSEINVLADVFQSVREYEYGRAQEDDFILLGDLNVSESGLGQLSTIPGVISIAGDIQTNVGRDKTYDHILIDRQVTAEYAKRMGVIDLQQTYNLSKDAAKTISDHVPLWAEFSIYEQAPNFGQSTAGQSTAAGPRTTLIQ